MLFDTVDFDSDFACFVEGADRLFKHFFTHAKGGVNGGGWAFVIEREEALLSLNLASMASMTTPSTH